MIKVSLLPSEKKYFAKTWTDGVFTYFILLVYTVSMVDGDLFDKLARIGSILRKKAEPFGGIQVRPFPHVRELDIELNGR